MISTPEKNGSRGATRARSLPALLLPALLLLAVEAARDAGAQGVPDAGYAVAESGAPLVAPPRDETPLEIMRKVPVVGILFKGTWTDVGIKLGVIVLLLVVGRLAISSVKSAGKERNAHLLRTLEANGKFLQAGNMLLMEGNSLEALRMFNLGEHWDRAAQVYIRVKDFTKAAEMFEKAGQMEDAADYYRKVRKNLPAAACLAKCKGEERRLEAAALYEQEGDFAKAAWVLQELGRYEKAAEVLERSDKPNKDDLIARMYESALDGVARQAAAAGLTAEHEQKMKQLAAKAARYYEMRGALPMAASVLMKGRCFAEAGRVYETQLSNFSLAAEAYQKAGNVDRAATMYKKSGEDKAAHELMATYFEDKGDILAAAENLVKAERYEEAVRKYEEYTATHVLTEETAENYYRYALALEKAGSPLLALPVYEKILDLNKSFRDVLIRVKAIRQATVTRGSAPAPSSPPRGGTAAARGDDTETAAEAERYEIVAELGAGGMGVVYKARDRVLERIVALKLLSVEAVGNPTAEKYFMREARSAALLNHQSLVTIFDLGHFRGQPFISMEIIEGKTVKELLRAKGKFTVIEFLTIAEQTLAGLAYAHGSKVIHRDLKPANIMITGNEVKVGVKIMDFGLAKQVDDRSQTTVIAGTPLYMPIEQTLGNATDHRSDIFALGVTFFEMVTGQLPYPEGVLATMPDTKPPSARALNPAVPVKLDAILKRMIQRSADERYASTQEIHDDVRGIIKTIQQFGAKAGRP